MDDECLAALSSVEKQYGDVITHLAGLEVRLGEETPHVDYILCLDEKNIPNVQALWYELDYSEYKQAADQHREIKPCLFVNVAYNETDGYGTFCDELVAQRSIHQANRHNVELRRI